MTVLVTTCRTLTGRGPLLPSEFPFPFPCPPIGCVVGVRVGAAPAPAPAPAPAAVEVEEVEEVVVPPAVVTGRSRDHRLIFDPQISTSSGERRVNEERAEKAALMGEGSVVDG